MHGLPQLALNPNSTRPAGLIQRKTFMEVHVESTGALTRSLHVTVPAAEFEKEVGEQLKQIARQARIPGFRPGHAPMTVVRQRYGASAHADALSGMLQKTYPDALKQAGVEPAGAPRIEIESEPPEKPFGYVAHFDVLPEVKLDKLDTLEVDRPQVEVTEADIDKLVANLRKQRHEWVAVERAAANGDQVNLDFEGKLDGEAFAGGKGEKVDAELGSGRFIADLETAIVGHKAGDVFTADVKFPDDYQAKELAGKAAQFDVTLNSVKQEKLPEVDAEFLKAHGVDEAAGEAGLRAKCKTALEAERDKAVRMRLKEGVMEKLMAAHPIELPPSRVEHEIGHLREEMVERMGLNRYGNNKLTPEKSAEMLPANLFEGRARQRVALSLLLSEFVSSQKLKVDEARVEKLLDGIAVSYEDPEQLRQYYRSNEQLMSNLRGVALEDQAVDALLALGTVHDKRMSMDELMNPKPPAAAQASA